MTTRNGKIARLPRSLREELNERLDCGEDSSELLPWLNELPQVKEVLQNHFAGAPISKQNLSEWRKGGFAEWLGWRNLCHDTHELTHWSEEMDEEESDAVLADDVAKVLTARIGSLIGHWDGEVDERFVARAKVLNGLCRSVVQLQRGVHQAEREILDRTDRLKEWENAEREVMKRKLLAPIFHATQAGTLGKFFGGGETGLRLGRYILEVLSGNLDADLDLPPQPAADESVKPGSKSARRKNGQFVKRQKTCNNLKVKEMNASEASPERPDKSSPVKPGQTMPVNAEERQNPPGAPGAQAHFCLPGDPFVS